MARRVFLYQQRIIDSLVLGGFSLLYGGGVRILRFLRRG